MYVLIFLEEIRLWSCSHTPLPIQCAESIVSRRSWPEIFHSAKLALKLSKSFSNSEPGIVVFNKIKGYWWIACIQSKRQFMLTTKNTFCILRISSFWCIQEKKNIAVDTILSACEASWKLTVLLQLLSRKSVHSPEQIIPGALKGRGCSN